MVATFCKTISSEVIGSVAWQSRQRADNAVARYFDGLGDSIRRHSSRGFQSPIDGAAFEPLPLGFVTVDIRQQGQDAKSLPTAIRR